MKVVHVISSISRHLGGPSRSVQGIVAALEGQGVESWLLSLAPSDMPWFPGIRHSISLNRKRKIDFSLKNDLRKTLEELRPDLVHIHGFWLWEIHQTAQIARELSIPYVVAPRGMLSRWALHQKWWKKLPAWWLYQRHDLKKARAFHATSEMEAAAVRECGFKQPVLISPNGVLVPERLPERKHVGKPHIALFLARLHPGKGLMSLAEAWGQIRPQGWKMRVVGFDGYGEKARLAVRLKELSIEDDWIFDDPMDDRVKWQAFVDADLFILPSVSENFGISIAEALYAGLPVITTKGTPWKELETEKCGWWVDLGVEPLEAAMRASMAMDDDERKAMGRRGHELIAKKYTWPSIGKHLKKDYHSIILKNTYSERHEEHDHV